MRGSRWGAVLAMLLWAVLDASLAGRYRLAPRWASMSAGGLLMATLIATAYVRDPRWARAGRIVMVSLIVATLLLNAANLIDVVDDVLFHPKGIDATALILTSLGIWSANVLAFSLLYWAMDRGGPDARAASAPVDPDFDFPAYKGGSGISSGWNPGFIDYLFIGFTTATAFSPTEAMPLSARAKLLMIFQSLVSLITVIVVAARAIGIIPS